MRNSVVNLSKKLISIPSYVDADTNEGILGRFLYTYINRNYPWLKICRQKVESGRYNIIALDGFDPKLVFISHLDTVKPCNKNQLKPFIKGNKLYGLGAADMKAGIAACLTALSKFKNTKGLALIFDCDEEYYFAGIKKVMTKYLYNPKLVICPEPTGLELINGCRGLVEIRFDVIGKTARAATPQNGVNAIEKAVELVGILRKKIITNDNKNLGQTTVNLSSLSGGRLSDNKITIQANAVADVARVLLDIRIANKKMTATRVLELIEKIAKKLAISIRNAEINLDYPPYFSNKVKIIEKALKEQNIPIKYNENLGEGGFYEASIISNAWNCPTLTFGPRGEGHIENEYVDIKSIEKTAQVYESLIKLLCT